jgi:hypothetical protein
MHQPSDQAALLTRAVAAYDELVSLAEEVEDEWSYIQDLSGAWRDELEGAARIPVPPSAAAAVERLIEEVGLIADPHRAIDWLSTFPQAVLLALGADPWAVHS